MPHDVFISYSSKDKSVADAVCEALESRGLPCWMAPRDIQPGTDWAPAIIDAINSSQVMVLVFSSSSNESQQVKREVERAVNRGIPLIPFRIENTPMSKALEYFISTPHWLDALTPPLEQHLERLGDAVALLLEPAEAPTAEAASVGSATHELVYARRRGAGGRATGTLAQALVPTTGWVSNAALIAASAVGIAILAQIDIGPIWLQPLALLLAAAFLGATRGGAVAMLYVALGLTGLPVYGDGRSAWTELTFRAPYVQHALGYLIGLVVAAFAVGWLAERYTWDRRIPTAGLLALAGTAILYVPGLVWVNMAASMLREPRPQAALLPSIPMLFITVAVLAVVLPQAWTFVARQRQPRLTRDTKALQPEPNT